MLDVDSKNVSLGMSCPPAAFVEAQFLKSVDQILNPSGKSLWSWTDLLINYIQKHRAAHDSASRFFDSSDIILG